MPDTAPAQEQTHDTLLETVSESLREEQPEKIAELIRDKDDGVSTLALIAAAYMADKQSCEAVEKLRSIRGAKAAAELLFRIRTGMETDSKKLSLIWQKSQRVRSGLSKANGRLFESYLILPGACIACEAFGEIGGEAVHGPLKSALRSPDIRVQVEAVRAIGQIGDESLARPQPEP